MVVRPLPVGEKDRLRVTSLPGQRLPYVWRLGLPAKVEKGLDAEPVRPRDVGVSVE